MLYQLSYCGSGGIDTGMARPVQATESLRLSRPGR
jgi:hypothetical protein